MKYYIITSLSQVLIMLFLWVLPVSHLLHSSKKWQTSRFPLCRLKKVPGQNFLLLNCIHFREILVASSDKKWPEPYLHKVMNNVFILSMFDLLKTKNTSVSFSNVLACVSSCEALDGLIWQNFFHKLCIWKV